MWDGLFVGLKTGIYVGVEGDNDGTFDGVDVDGDFDGAYVEPNINNFGANVVGFNVLVGSSVLGFNVVGFVGNNVGVFVWITTVFC